MRSSSFLAPLFFAASSLAQAVPEGIAPSSPPPSGCETSANGNFTIGTLKLAHTKRETAVEAADGALLCNLKDGVLRDSYHRIGSVVANRQFQFDGPPQAGAIYTGGFSICKNGSLAIGGTTRWWQCSSGPFYNLYDEWIGAQCEEIRIQVQLINQPSASATGAASVTGGSSSATSPVASVVSSLATISGSASLVSASAVGPTASASRNGTVTSSHASSATSLTASVSRAATTGAASASGSGSPAAPPAGGAASSLQGSIIGAVVAFVGAAVAL